MNSDKISGIVRGMLAKNNLQNLHPLFTVKYHNEKLISPFTVASI